MLPILLSLTARAQTTDVGVAAAEAVNDGSLDMLTGVLGGGGGASGVIALFAFLLWKGVIKLPERPAPDRPIEVLSRTAESKLDELHRTGMRRGDNDELYYPALLTDLRERQARLEQQIAALLASSTTTAAVLTRLAQAMEAREGKGGGGAL
jgi:hypothetical protein